MLYSTQKVGNKNSNKLSHTYLLAIFLLSTPKITYPIAFDILDKQYIPRKKAILLKTCRFSFPFHFGSGYFFFKLQPCSLSKSIKTKLTKKAKEKKIYPSYRYLVGIF